MQPLLLSYYKFFSPLPSTPFQQLRTMKLLVATFVFLLVVYNPPRAGSLPCSPDVSVSWVVEDSAGASDLANATNCSGGVFDVEWVGNVQFPETIHVADGTVLSIRGAGAGAVADGSSRNQFLNVFDATVHVSGLRIENCSSGGDGGAIFARASVMTFNETSFIGNNAGNIGGALYVEGSIMSWGGETSFLDNNAGNSGGALYLFQTNGSWSGETSFLDNSADSSGGALHSHTSNVSWSGKTSFAENSGYGYKVGGALYAFDSNVFWSGEMSFSNNTTGYEGDGGALCLFRSELSWSGKTSFSHNTVGVEYGNVGQNANGGALFLEFSNVYWRGETNFSGNTASSGGAIHVESESSVSWSEETIFVGNNAISRGGAISITPGDAAALDASPDLSTISWIGKTLFSGNTAEDGGALSASDPVAVSWSGETSFLGNYAGANGGAVFAGGESMVAWTTETTFSYNTCQGSGGAVYLASDTYLSPSTSVFEGNTAGDAGGAVFMAGVGTGPVFARSTFTNNSSPRGGAVYSASSGVATIDFVKYPTMYEDCLFADNRASATGGAIESVAGYDQIVDSVFEGNTAGVGGALRLGGSAVLTNCTFVDNISDEDGGAAISNLGVLEVNGGATRFSGNVFWCENGTYLDYVDGDRYKQVCDGCDECDGCEVENADRVPICTSQLEHTRSDGGDTTVEALEVDAGYWRATNTSVDVLACYNEDACCGGVTNTPNFCKQGYEGPCE